jgi:hypothetical protein
MKEKLKKSLNNETRKTTLVFIIQHCKNDLPKNLLYITTANYQNWNKKIDKRSTLTGFTLKAVQWIWTISIPSLWKITIRSDIKSCWKEEDVKLIKKLQMHSQIFVNI